MANEYLQRTPTSTGNRRVWTWSTWVKRNSLTSTNQNLLCSTEPGLISKLFFNTNDKLDYQNNSPSFELITSQTFRDVGNWFHILFVAETTASISSERIRIYVNGARITKFDTETYPAINSTLIFNYPIAHFISKESSSTNWFIGEFADIFFIDGQALTPDVFGFYKQGKGYISVGSTQATDFRPGQWVPKTPRVIKTEINRRGGFGVNGFYLPMNDSRNFGADFHGDPNSIITLNEKLPQPRVGVATTASVGLGYTDALRADPYAANLVLALPGVYTNPIVNLIDNGNFSTGDFTNWSVNGSTTPTISNGGALLSVGAIDGAIWQSVSGEATSGKWIIKWTVTSLNGGYFGLFLNNNGPNGSGGSLVLDNITTSGSYYYSGSITAVEFRHRGGGTNGIIDNIELVSLQDSVKDYSADIKGSGTNKTLTSNGTAGIDYRVPSYYGSALSFDGNGDYLRTSTNISDFQFGNGDFTIETWLWKSANGANNYDGVASLGTNGSATDGWFLEVSSTRGYLWYVAGSGTYQIQYNVSPNTSQWNHLAVCRKGNTTTMYLNGVAVGINTNAYTVPATATTLDVGGYAVGTGNYWFNGYLQDLRIYKGVAKYTGGFDVPRPYTPVGISTWRAVPDTNANNFATLNPLYPVISGSNSTYTNGNLTVSDATSNGSQVSATIGVSTGKWYYEALAGNVSGGSHLIGIRPAEWFTFNPQNRTSYRSDGSVYNDAGGTAQSGTSYSSSNIIGVAIDMNTRKLWFSKNGSFVYSGNPSAGTNEAVSFASTYTHYAPAVMFDNVAGTQTWDTNFGQNPTFSGNTTAGTFTDSNGKGLFKYQPPSGFLALCEDNLPTPAISDPGKYFKTVLWTGDGAPRSIVGVGFTTDFVWIKGRTQVSNSFLFDSIRGATNRICSSLTNVEASEPTTLTSFSSDGFSLGTDAGVGACNISGQTYVAWCWRAGAGTTSTNTNGSITSVVSVNQDAGFSIVSYTGNGSNPTTVGHGLTKAPKFIIFKCRNAAVNWFVYHGSMGPSGIFEGLNTTSAYSASAAAVFNNTAPSSSVITLGGVDSNTNGRTYIAYCWAEIEGFSKFGSYSANFSADGPFCYCGFRPAFVIIKRTDSTGSWVLKDSSRNSANPADLSILAQTSDTEFSNNSPIDFLSNGFKLRSTSLNDSGATFIFAAWAESPFQTANSK